MEPDTKFVAVVTLVLALILTVATSQTICGMTMDGLNAFRPYLIAQNPTVAPLDRASLCCTAPSKADFQCFCKMKNSPFAQVIDIGLASELPQKCGLPAYIC